MGFKDMNRNFTFTDLSLSPSMEKNRAIKRMEEINTIVNWSPIEALLERTYPVGKSTDGNRAYPPILLMKCLLLQQWFRIDSDPELETQINDRISFKRFLGLSFDDPAPDHSTFSRFRGHFIPLKKGQSYLLLTSSQPGDVPLMKESPLMPDWCSRPAVPSVREHSKMNGKRERPGKGKKRKFSRDIESEWTAEKDRPLFGLKEHASVDTRYGFLLDTEITPASHHDSPYLPLCIAGSCHTGEPIQKVYADKGYFGEPNRAFCAMNGIADGIMRKATRGTKLTSFESARNKAIAKIRYIVEQYFGLTHLHNGASRARFTTIVKNATDALFRQFAFNLRRGIRILAA